jgi:predicted Rossmann fold nucleotide-binding protein DprA/Smf involved in DNA uptake
MVFGVVGSREFTDYSFMKKTLDYYLEIGSIDKIISGGARGADTLAKKYAMDNEIPFQEFIAEWEQYGKSAGFIRNEKIVNNIDMLVAFPVKGIENKGTMHSIRLAQKQNKDVVICEYEFDETERIG